MNGKQTFNIRTLAMTGVLAALVFAASTISVNIPTPIDNTRLHLGNVICLLSGLLLGPIPGGLAAGIGSLFFDLTNPLYISTAPFTLVFKFLMAFACGKIASIGGANGESFRLNVAGAVAGALLYVVLYLGKNFVESYFFLRLELETVLITLAQKGVASTVNGVIAVVAAVPLAAALRKGLQRTGLPMMRAQH